MGQSESKTLTKKADDLVEQGNADLAILEYRRVLAEHPDALAAWIGQSVVYRILGDFDSAMAVISQALSRYPRSYAALVERGRIHCAKGDYAAAQRDVEDAIKLKPARPAAYVVRAHIRDRKKDEKGASLDLDRAVRLSADDSEAWRARAFFNMRHDALLKKAQADLERALKIHPYAQNYEGLMRCLDRQGNTRAATSVLVAGLKRYPANPDLLKGQFSRLMARHRHQEALSVAEKIIAINPKSFVGYELKGQVEIALLDDDAAIRSFGRAIELKPDHVYLYIERAKVYGECGKNELALADLNNACQRAGDKTDALNERGQLLLSMKRRDEALRDFDELIKLNPNDTRAYHNRATIHFLKNDFARAEKDWDKAISLQPTASCFERRGILLLKLERYKEAARDFTRVLSMQNSPRALRGRALAYEKLGMTVEAAKDRAACASDLPGILEHYGDLSTSFSKLKKELGK